MSPPLWADLGRRLREAPEGVIVTLFAPSPAAVWVGLGWLGVELDSVPQVWHHLALHGTQVASSFRPGHVVYVVGFEALVGEARSEVYAHLNRARDQLPALGIRVVIFAPAADEDRLADAAVDLLAFRGPVRRLPAVEGGPVVVLPPDWEIVRDTAARLTVAWVGEGAPPAVAAAVRSVRWGAVLWASGDWPLAKTAAEVPLAVGSAPPNEVRGDRGIIGPAHARRVVDVVEAAFRAWRDGAEGGEPGRDDRGEEVVLGWLAMVRLAADRPEPVRWRREGVSPLDVGARPAQRELTLVLPGGRTAGESAEHRRIHAEDEAAASALRLAEAIESRVPRGEWAPLLAVASDVVVVGHGLQVEATLDAAGLTHGSGERGGPRVHRPWGAVGQALRADPWPFPGGRAPSSARQALGRRSVWIGWEEQDPRLVALYLWLRGDEPRLVVGRHAPTWVQESGATVVDSLSQAEEWAQEAPRRGAARGPLEPPIPELPDDPLLVETVARPRVVVGGVEEPLLPLLVREGRLWVEGVASAGKTLFAELLAFGVAARGTGRWSAWAEGIPEEIQTVRLRRRLRPGASPPAGELWIVDDVHKLLWEERQELAWAFEGGRGGGWVLVLDRPQEEHGPGEPALWVPAPPGEGWRAWYAWCCRGRPAAGFVAAAEWGEMTESWSRPRRAEVVAELLENEDPEAPSFMLPLYQSEARVAWPESTPHLLGMVHRAIQGDHVVLPEVAVRHFPGAVTRGVDGQYTLARAGDAVLGRAFAIDPYERWQIPEASPPDPADVEARVLAILDADQAGLLPIDVVATWAEWARTEPVRVVPYLAELLRCVPVALSDLEAILADADPKWIPIRAELRATQGFRGTFPVGSQTAPRLDEAPVRNVHFSPFRLDVAPVTNARFAAFVRGGGYHRPDLWHPDGWAWRLSEALTGPRTGGGPAHPVTGVSWYEADAFARWAGGSLPSEGQWEAAAVFGGRGPWADQVVPVMTGRGAPYDMGGNVLEWCLDGYDPDFPAFAPAWDPVGPERPERSARGAPFWVRDPEDRHPWRRWHIPPTTRRDDLGFRVAWRG